MSTASQTPRRHPVAAVVARLHAELDAVTEVPVWTLGEAEAEALLLEATRLRARVAALELRVAGHADRVEVGLRHGATSTANWWAHASRLTRAEAHRRIRLARSLQTHEDVAAALADGELVEDQAVVITHAVDELPTALVDDDTIARARAHLLTEARSYDAKALRVLGRRVLEVVAPQVGEEHERRLLEAEERDARSGCRFSMVEDGHGKTHGRFTLPTPQAQMLRKALLALAAPKHTRHAGHTPPHARRPSAERLGAAFCEYVESYPADRLPDAGGIPASVVVTVAPGQPGHRARVGPAGHRRRHLRFRSAQVGVPGRDPPRGPRQQVTAPRPGPHQAVPHQSAADRDGRPRPGMHRRGL